MVNLLELANLYGTDKAGNGYIPAYEQHFEPVRNEVRGLLELGVLNGASLQMWRDYFPLAQIFGVDINPQTKKDLGDRITVITASQDNEQELLRIRRQCDLDIVIDDASHIDKLTLASYRILAPVVSRFYVMEDMGCSYDKNIIEQRSVWPGMAYNTRLPEADWFNKRLDMDDFLADLIHQLDGGRGLWKSINLYHMLYIFTAMKPLLSA
jgi:hypothetical protein